MNVPLHTLRLLPIIVFLSAIVACSKQHEQVEINQTECFRSGDLVLRRGFGAESRVVVERSRSSYSHIGILLYDSLAAEWKVIHAVPGESAQGEPEYLKCEPLCAFFSPERASAGAWMRIDCPDSVARRAALYCHRKAEEKVVFDNDYLLSDTTELYCCELVWRAYMQSGIDISSGARYDVPTIICKEGECIFPANIERGEHTLFVKQFKSKSHEKGILSAQCSIDRPDFCSVLVLEHARRCSECVSESATGE